MTTQAVWSATPRIPDEPEVGTRSTKDLEIFPGLPSLRLPMRSFNTLWHVGSLDPDRKGSTSFEGRALSASTCPLAWRSIARLGGEDLWCADARALIFLDFHAMPRASKDLLRERMVSDGWLEKTRVYRSWGTDEEGDEWYMEHATKAAALAEQGDQSDRMVRSYPSFKPGPVLREVYPAIVQGCQHLGSTVEQIALMEAVNRSGWCDGVFFADRFDPDHLSAPRVAIAPNRVAGLGWTRVTWRSSRSMETV